MARDKELEVNPSLTTNYTRRERERGLTISGGSAEIFRKLSSWFDPRVGETKEADARGVTSEWFRFFCGSGIGMKWFGDMRGGKG
jgi:hypothetical protein